MSDSDSASFQVGTADLDDPDNLAARFKSNHWCGVGGVVECNIMPCHVMLYYSVLQVEPPVRRCGVWKEHDERVQRAYISCERTLLLAEDYRRTSPNIGAFRRARADWRRSGGYASPLRDSKHTARQSARAVASPQ